MNKGRWIEEAEALVARGPLDRWPDQQAEKVLRAKKARVLVKAARAGLPELETSLLGDRMRAMADAVPSPPEGAAALNGCPWCER
jgi:hypothetical protein